MQKRQRHVLEREAYQAATGERICSKCGISKPLSEYAKGGAAYRYANGLMTVCKACWKVYADDWRAKNPDKHRGYQAKTRAREKAILGFFEWRARKWNEKARHGGKITPKEIMSLWKRQRGYCALSGRKLGRNAHLDHILPVSEGGKGTISNLRWVDPDTNRIRSAMSDDEFFVLCKDVIRYQSEKARAGQPGEKDSTIHVRIHTQHGTLMQQTADWNRRHTSPAVQVTCCPECGGKVCIDEEYMVEHYAEAALTQPMAVTSYYCADKSGCYWAGLGSELKHSW